MSRDEAVPDRVWRVFYTRARAEKKCEERLHRQELEVFLPKRTEVRKWADRKKKVTEPLFRNYIFARVDERERLAVLRTQGIVRCVHFGGRIAEVREEEIEQIRIAQKDPRKLLVVDEPPPDVGEKVIVTGGPMRGLKGEVLEHRGQMHVLVRVSAIRQALKVQVPAAWVRPGHDLHTV